MRRRPSVPKRVQSEGSASKVSRRSARAVGSAGGMRKPETPSSICSVEPPMLVAITGRLMPMASMTTPPKGSGWPEGRTKIVMAAKAGRASEISPVKITESSSW